MIDIQKLSTGQKLRNGPDVATIAAVYYQGGQWRADLRFDDDSVYMGEDNEGLELWGWELIR